MTGADAEAALSTEVTDANGEFGCPICNEFRSTSEETLQLHVDAHLQQQENLASEQLASALTSNNAGTQNTRGIVAVDGSNGVSQYEAAELAQLAALQGLNFDSAVEVQELNGETVLVNQCHLQDATEAVKTALIADVVQTYRKPRANADVEACKTLKSVHVCSELDHYQTNIYGHGWDCGYKNVQTMLSSVMRDKKIREHLAARCDLRDVPTLPELQSRIDEAWARGFDAGAREQIGDLFGSSKWIGANEAAAVLRSFGLRARVLDFEVGLDVRKQKYMADWIVSYFTNRCRGTSAAQKLLQFGAGGCPACRNGKTGGGAASSRTSTGAADRGARLIPPLFLQHQGHSRAVIGAERHSDGSTRILVLDPGRKCVEGLSGDVGLSKLRKALDAEELTEAHYQIVFISLDWKYESQKDLEAAKHIISESVLPNARLL